MRRPAPPTPLTAIRVSKTLTGLKQSTKSGNWLLFNLGSASGVDDTFANVFELELSAQEAACIAAVIGSAITCGVEIPEGLVSQRPRYSTIRANTNAKPAA